MTRPAHTHEGGGETTHGPAKSYCRQLMVHNAKELVLRRSATLRRIYAAAHPEWEPLHIPPGWPDYDDPNHPERIAVLPHLEGRVIEVGCGPRKSTPGVIGVDLVPAGQFVPMIETRPSEADVVGDGRRLPIKASSVDTLVARHNLEHYVNIAGVLEEWYRVLRPGGRLVVVVPDEDAYPGRTVMLDPTHYHAFDQPSLSRLCELVGFAVEHVAPAIPKWSFVLVALKPPRL